MKRTQIHPTMRQRKAVQVLVENGGNVSQAMIAAGYSPKVAHTPQRLTESDGFRKLMAQFLDDDLLIQKHRELLESSYVDHMVFPSNMTDEEILILLKDANCIVKKFKHDPTQTHVWYFASDNHSRKEALDMAYKLRGSYAPEKKVSINLFSNVLESIEQNSDPIVRSPVE